MLAVIGLKRLMVVPYITCTPCLERMYTGVGQWLPPYKCNITLECCGEEWDVVWMGARNGFSGGWRGFAIDQRLTEGDAVVFKKEDGLKLRVTIFRWYTCCSVHGVCDAYGAVGFTAVPMMLAKQHLITQVQHTDPFVC